MGMMSGSARQIQENEVKREAKGRIYLGRGDCMKQIQFIITALLVICTYNLSLATDPPHNSNPNADVTCNSCHQLHAAPGVSLMSDADNANLCMSCHKDTGDASGKPLTDAEQAVPGISGTNHRHDRSMKAGDPPLNLAVGDNSNIYGLVTTDEISNPILKTKVTAFNNVVTCSVCHSVHSQGNAAWDVFAGSYTGLRGGDFGTATGGGLGSIEDNSKSTYWTNDVWQNFSVKMRSGTAANIGQIRQITGNTTTQLTVSSNFPAAVQPNDGYEIIGRHFQRIANDLNQICEDCHSYRVQTHTRVEGGDAGYPADGINVFSHPVGQALNANAGGYDRAAPLDVNGVAQSGTRSATGGESPDNTTNNLVLDSTNKVRCLTCHRVHFSDSNSLTVDVP